MSKLRWAISVFAWAILMFATSFATSEDGDYTIRSQSNEVRVLFSAEDAQGHPIAQLEPKDIAIVDNDEVIRKFRSFGPVSETPLHVAILVDVSDSLSKQVANEFQVLETFLDKGKWTSSDEVSVLAFSGTEAKVLCRASCREHPVALAEPSLGSTTPLFDALISASELLSRTRTPNSRAAIVVLSDGCDNISMHGLRNAISAAQLVEASVYTVNSRAKRADSRGDSVLAQIAIETGGVAYTAGQGTAEALDGVLDDLRQGFVLTYQLPHSESARHEVKVLPTLNSRLRFRSRLSYTAVSSGAQ